MTQSQDKNSQNREWLPEKAITWLKTGVEIITNCQIAFSLYLMFCLWTQYGPSSLLRLRLALYLAIGGRKQDMGALKGFYCDERRLLHILYHNK